MSLANRPPALCLASASPRRRELLLQIGVPHCIDPADLDEQLLRDESAEQYVERLALAKARATHVRRAQLSALQLPVLGADTTVTVAGRVLGKPASEAELLDMFTLLSGRVHEVLSAVALVARDFEAVRLVRTQVRFREVSEAEARAYWASGEPRDKAGGYAIQGYGAVFVERIDGSYSGVVGLPLAETATLLFAAGMTVWHSGV